MEEREVARQAAIAQFRREIQIGIEEADRGELVDSEEVIAEMEQLSETRRHPAV